jgi:GntR family transcriptional regulator, rspAB operon transcriptional repressor
MAKETRHTLPPADDETAVGGGRASKRAYEYLREGILSGEIPAGTFLAEGEIAAALGVSRTPVRQALRLLLQEDLVEVGYRRQLAVRGVSAERRREVFLLRHALEEVAVTEAARSIAIEDVDQLRLLVMRQRRAAAAEKRVEFISLDEEFHGRIATSANLPTLHRFLSQLRAFIRLMGTEAITREGRMPQVVDEHEKIIDAIEARDALAAVAAVRHHLAETERTLQVKEQEDREQKPPSGERRPRKTKSEVA